MNTISIAEPSRIGLKVRWPKADGCMMSGGEREIEKQGLKG